MSNLAIKSRGKQKLVRKYQRIMGWTDQSIITILCNYIDAVQPDSGAGYDSHLQEFLEEYLEECWGESAQLISAAPALLDLAREVAGVAETVAALLCSPGEATKTELVSAITDLGAKAAALVNDATKGEA